MLEQLRHKGSCITLDQCVLLPLDGLHEGPDHRVELVRQQLQVDHSAGREHVHAQVQLVPFAVGLRHGGLGLLPSALQGLPLFGLHVQTGRRL